MSIEVSQPLSNIGDFKDKIMFKRHDGNHHQNPPKVFGPGSDLRERVEHQDIIIEELINIITTHLPGEGKEAATRLKDHYEESLRALRRHQSMKILNGQGEHASLEHYIHRFTTPDPANNEPYPFPNPKSSIYNVLSELIGKHITQSHRELQLKGAGRRKLGPDDSITDCESDIYTDADGELVVVLVGSGVVGKWSVKPWVRLLQHTPAQTFFKRSHVEELVGVLFNLLSNKYGVCFKGDQPLTPSYLIDTLASHLPKQFSPNAKSTYLQPSEFMNLRVAPIKGIEAEFDNLAEGCPLLRIRLDPRSHDVDHVFMFRVRDEGYISYSACEGLTFWFYSSAEGVWTGIYDYLPYIPKAEFDETMQVFFDAHNYTPPVAINADLLGDLAIGLTDDCTPSDIHLGDLKNVEKTGYFKVSDEDTNTPLHVIHVGLAASRTKLLVVFNDDKSTPKDIHAVDGITGKRHEWDDLNPQLKECFLRTLEAL